MRHEAVQYAADLVFPVAAYRLGKTLQSAIER